MTSHSSITLPGLGEVPVVALGTIEDGSVPPGFGSDDEEPIFLTPLQRRLRERGAFLGYGLSSVSMLTSMAMAARLGRRELASSLDRDGVSDRDATSSDTRQHARLAPPGLLDIHRRVAELSLNTPRPPPASRPDESVLGGQIAPRANQRWWSMGRSSDEVEDYSETHHADSVEELAFRNRVGTSYRQGGNGQTDEDNDEVLAEIDSEDEGELYTEYFDEEEEEEENGSYEARTSGEHSRVAELPLAEAPLAAPALSSSLESAASGDNSRPRRRRSTRHSFAQGAFSASGGHNDTDSQEAEPLLAAHRIVPDCLSASISRGCDAAARQPFSDTLPPSPVTATDPVATPAPLVTVPPLASPSPAPPVVPPARPPTRPGRSLAVAWAAARFALSAMLAPLRLFLSITGLSERVQQSARNPAAGYPAHSRPIVLSPAATSLPSGTETPLATDAREPDSHNPHGMPRQHAGYSPYSGAGPPLRPSSPPSSAAEEARAGGSDGRGGVCSTETEPLPAPLVHSTCLVGAPALPADAAITQEAAVLADTAAGCASGSDNGSGISALRGTEALCGEGQRPQSQPEQVISTPPVVVGSRLPDIATTGEPVRDESGPSLPSSDGMTAATACRQAVALPPLDADSNGCVAESPDSAPSPLPVSEFTAQVEPALSSAPMTFRTPLEEWTEDDVSLDDLDLHSTGDGIIAWEHSDAEPHANRATAPASATGTGASHQLPDSGDSGRGALGGRTMCTATSEGGVTRARTRPRLAWQAAGSEHELATSEAALDSCSGAEDKGADADTECSDTLWDEAGWARRAANPGQLLGASSAVGAGGLPRESAGGYSPRRKRQQGQGTVASTAGATDCSIAWPDWRAHRSAPLQQHWGRRTRLAQTETSSRFAGLLGPRTGAAWGPGTSSQPPPQTGSLSGASPHENSGYAGADDSMGSFGMLASLAQPGVGVDLGFSGRRSISPAVDSAAPQTAGGAVVHTWRDTELAALEEIAMQVLGEAVTEPVGGGLEPRLSVPPLTDDSSSSDGSVFDSDVGDDGLVCRWAIPRTASLRGVCHAWHEIGEEHGAQSDSGPAIPEDPVLTVSSMLGDSNHRDDLLTRTRPAGLIVPPSTRSSCGRADAAQPSSRDDSDDVMEVWWSPHRWAGGSGGSEEEPAQLMFGESDGQMPALFSSNEEEEEKEDVEEEEENGAMRRWPRRSTVSGSDAPPPPLFSDDSDNDDSDGGSQGDGENVLPPLFSDEEDNIVIGASASDIDVSGAERSYGATADEDDSAGSSDDDEPPPLLSSGELNPVDSWDVGILNPPRAQTRAGVLQPQPPNPRPPPARSGPAAAGGAVSTSRAAAPRAGPGAHSWISDPWLVPLSRAVTGSSARSATPSQPSAASGGSAPTRVFPRSMGLQRPQAPEPPRTSLPPRAEARSNMPPLISSSDDSDDEPDGIRRLGRRIHTFSRRLQQASDRAAALVAARREAAAVAADSTPSAQHRAAVASATTAPSPGGLRLELGAAAEAVLEALVPALLGAASANASTSLSGGGSGASTTGAAPPRSSANYATGPDPDRTRRPRPAGVTTQILSAVIRLPAEALSSVPNGSVLSITLPPLGEGILSGSGGTEIGTANGTLRLQLGGVSSFPMSWRSYLPQEDTNGRNPNDQPWLPGTYEEHEIPAWAARFAPPRQAEASRPTSSPGASVDTSPRATEAGAGGVEGAPRVSSSHYDPARSDAPGADPHNSRTADADPAGRPALWEDFSFATDSAESIDSLPDLVPLDYIPAGTGPPARRRSLPAGVLATHAREGVPRQDETRSADAGPVSPVLEARRPDRADRTSRAHYGVDVQDNALAARRRSFNEGNEGQDRIPGLWRTGSDVSTLGDQGGQAVSDLEGSRTAQVIHSPLTLLPDGPPGALPSSAEDSRSLTEEAHHGRGRGRRQFVGGFVDSMDAVEVPPPGIARTASLPMLPFPPLPMADSAAQAVAFMDAELGVMGADGSRSTPESAVGAAAAGSAIGTSAFPARRNAMAHMAPSRVLQDMMEAIQNVDAAAAGSTSSGPRDRVEAQRNVRLAGTHATVGALGLLASADGDHRTSSSEMRRQVDVAALLRDEDFLGQVLEGIAGVEAHPPAYHVMETVRWMLAGPLAAVDAV